VDGIETSFVTSSVNLFIVLLLQPVILDYLASKMISAEDLVVVSPDVGGVARARAFAKKLSDAPLAIVDKRRQGHNVSEVSLVRAELSTPQDSIAIYSAYCFPSILLYCPVLGLHQV
jgi:phosphoribosylpyrophosphate synthetase